MPFTPTGARAAVLSSWANTTDPSERTRPARRKFDERFVDQVDPDRTLPEADRERRAAAARRAYFLNLAEKSRIARAKSKGAA